MNSFEKLVEYCSGYALTRDLPYTKGGLFVPKLAREVYVVVYTFIRNEVMKHPYSMQLKASFSFINVEPLRS